MKNTQKQGKFYKVRFIYTVVGQSRRFASNKQIAEGKVKNCLEAAGLESISFAEIEKDVVIIN